MLIKTVGGACLTALTAVAVSAPSAQAATGSVTIYQTGYNTPVMLSWNGGNECQFVQLAPALNGPVSELIELQFKSTLPLNGYYSSNCTKMTVGGFVNGPDFVVETYGTLLHPSPATRSISLQPQS